jgi:hypothetical protein
MNTVSEYWQDYWDSTMEDEEDILTGYTKDDVRDDFYSGVLAGVLLVTRDNADPDIILREIESNWEPVR